MAERRTDTESTINEADLTWETFIGGFIGRGGLGEVYRATWKSKNGDVEVAAKKVRRQKGQSIEDLLGNKIFSLYKLYHPNIIQYYGHVINEDYVVIITEYATKGSLYDYLKDKKSLPSGLKLKWARQAAGGIRYLQENHILHRDVKSPNFMITAEDNLKICDFGIHQQRISTIHRKSEKGSVKWLAPETIKEEFQSSPTEDIFAFGIVLWELETCQVPYQDMMKPWTLMYEVVFEGLRPEIPATCSPVLRDLMQRCWDDDGANRPSINEIVHQLQQYQDGDRTKKQHDAFWSEEGSMISARQILDVEEVVSLPDMKRLCEVLHLTRRVIQDVLYSVREDDIGGQKRALLHEWHKRLGNEATTGKLLRAFLETGNKLAYDKLRNKWQI